MGKKTWKEDFRKNWKLYLIFLIPASWFTVFKYAPMGGLLMAFQDYNPGKGLLGSTWEGFDNFIELFTGDMFPLAVRNTCAMALLNLTFGFAAPIILGLLISTLRSKGASRVVQTVTYMPYFVSAVVVCSLAREFLNDTGAISQFLNAVFGLEKQNLLAVNSPAFWFINCFLGIWQGAGYSAIIYIASINNISPDLYEAAAIDGATRFKRLWHITIPSVLPIIIMMFTMQLGLVFMTGFDKVLLLYQPSTYTFADCLSTYTYRMAFGAAGSDFGLSTASGLIQSIVATILLVSGNKASQKIAKTSMF